MAPVGGDDSAGHGSDGHRWVILAPISGRLHRPTIVIAAKVMLP
jgi:hypothetical protein